MWYFKIKLAQGNTDISGVTSNEFKQLLQADIEQLTAQGNYFGEDLKITINDHGTEVEFGYPLHDAKYIFKNIFSKINHHDIDKIQREKFQDKQYSLQKISKFINKRDKYNAVENKGANLNKLPDNLSDAFFKQLFNENSVQGIILGEYPHGIEGSRKILIDYIETFKECGVSTICIEGLCYKAHQHLLDAYLKSDQVRPPIELIACADSFYKADDEKLSFTNILIFLKHHKIRVIALDHTTSIYEALSHEHVEFRLPSFNLYAKEIIKNEIPNEKYVVWVGALHAYDTDKTYRLDATKPIYSLKQLLPNTTNLVVSKEYGYLANSLFKFNYKKFERDGKAWKNLETDIFLECRK